jgi:hypothetical protein
MALEAAGYSLTDNILKHAKRWLVSPSAGTHNNSYWLVAPLVPWLETDSEILPTLQREMNKLRSAIDNGAQPHPDQYTLTFYLRVALAVPEIADPSAIARYVDKMRDSWNSNEGWAKRPDTTTSCYGVMTIFDPQFAASIKDDVVRLLETWSEQPERGLLRWRAPISTAYTIINLIECGLVSDSQVRALVDQAIAWLASTRNSDGLWQSDLPFGGTGDIEAREYPTAAIARALIAYASIDVPSIQGAVSAFRLTQARRRVRALKIWRLVLMSLLLLAGCWLFGHTIAAVAKSIDLEVGGFILGVAGIVVGFAAWMYPEALQSVVIWIRRKRLS